MPPWLLTTWGDPYDTIVLPRSAVRPHHLSEGSDFRHWSDAVDAALKHCVGLDKYTSERAHLHKIGHPFNEKQRKVSVKAARTICKFVSKSVLARVPHHLEIEPWELWDALEGQSKSFRLLDLPRELRDQVCAEYLRKYTAVTEYELWAYDTFKCRRCYGKNHHHGVPALLHVSRQLRQESTPVYFHGLQVVFDLGHFVGEYDTLAHDVLLPGVPAHILIGKWTKNLLRESMEHLRYLVLKFRVFRSRHRYPWPGYLDITIRFELDVKRTQRLQVHVRPELGQPKRWELDQWVQDCNQAEYGIMKALSFNPSLWMLSSQNFK